MCSEVVFFNQEIVSNKPGGGTYYAGSKSYTAGNGMSYTVGSTRYPAVKSCEKFELPNNKWTALPDMREARAYFNPCLFNGIIYLCGYYSQIMEAFSPETDTFLPVQIPVLENASGCLYVDNDLLVLNMENHILKFAAGQGGQLDKRSRVEASSFDRYQSSQPVVDKANGVYFMIKGGECLCFKMETGVQVKL